MGKSRFIIINPERDNVATALEDIPKGAILNVNFRGEDHEIEIKKEIPFGHKFALTALSEGDEAIKYGVMIGKMKKSVEPGDYVHTRQIQSLWHKSEFK